MKFLKGTRLYSIFTGTCPVCQKESMYKSNNPYRLTTVIEMNERCTHCGTKYQVEPSFFFGAMYVSYAVGVAIAVAAFVIAFLILKLSLLFSFLFIVISVLGLFPYILRISRNIWINLFMAFDPSKA